MLDNSWGYCTKKRTRSYKIDETLERLTVSPAFQWLVPPPPHGSGFSTQQLDKAIVPMIETDSHWKAKSQENHAVEFGRAVIKFGMNLQVESSKKRFHIYSRIKSEKFDTRSIYYGVTIILGNSYGFLLFCLRSVLKGQLNSKCLFWCHRLDQNTNEKTSQISALAPKEWSNQKN